MHAFEASFLGRAIKRNGAHPVQRENASPGGAQEKDKQDFFYGRRKMNIAAHCFMLGDSGERSDIFSFCVLSWAKRGARRIYKAAAHA